MKKTKRGLALALAMILLISVLPVSALADEADGEPQLSTEALEDAVKYIPYSKFLCEDVTGASSTVTFSVLEGTLPDGMVIKQNGELYGVPKVTGTFTFTIALGYRGTQVSEQEYTLTVVENTNENAYYATDAEEGYALLVAIPDEDTGKFNMNEALAVTQTTSLDTADTQISLAGLQGSLTAGSIQKINLGTDEDLYNDIAEIGGREGGEILDILEEEEEDEEGTVSIGENDWNDESETLMFKSEGPISTHMKLWLDGELLEEGVDYTVSEGSTAYEIYKSVLTKNGAGDHTLAAEHREGGSENGKMYVTSQNYKTVTQTSTASKASSGSSSSSSGKTSTTATTTTTTTTAKTFPFTDVLTSDWFYDEVKWAWEEELMKGVNETTFAPKKAISQATVLTVLARMADVDLDEYTTNPYSDIENGKWYTSAAVWAKQAGLLPDNTDFSGDNVISRDEMAQMLVKYLKRMGADCTVPSSAATFADRDLMTEKGEEAFQILYADSIFQGMGDNEMDPLGTTTRCQFSALIERVSDYLKL